MLNRLRSTVFLLTACATQVATHGHDGEDGHPHAAIAVKPAEMYAPTAMPDRIVLSWSGDPRTTQSVNWRTSVAVTQGIGEIVKAEAGPYFPEKAVQVMATAEALKSDLSTAHFHSITFQDLEPGSIYAYRLGDGTNWTEWFHFRTAAANQEPFSFIYFGDAQNNVRSMWSRVIRESHRDAPKAAFMLHAGDLINTAESDAEWGEWFGAGAWLNAMVPSVPIPGNHEQAKLGDGTRRLSHHWRPSFTLPTNGPDGLEETCYTFCYQNMRFIGLNSNTAQAEQTEWLAEVLEKNDSPWVVCAFHHPIYSSGKDRDNSELRAMWKPLFDKYQVDLVLTGHDHTYGRTGFEVPPVTPIPAPQDTTASTRRATAAAAKILVGTVNVPTGVQNVDALAGTVYVVSVSGPKMYSNQNQSFMKRVAEDTQLYQIIHINGNSLRFEARTAVGELYDAFELQKTPGQINKLIEIEPQVPQNLRPQQVEEVAK